MIRQKLKYLFITLLFVGVFSCEVTKKQQDQDDNTISEEISFNGTLKVLSLNTWHETTRVEGGFEALAEVIEQAEADIVMLCEINNYNNVTFSTKIVGELKKRGIEYHSFNSGKSPIILSKYNIIATPSIASNSLTKCIVEVNDETTLAVYAAHLDYTHYACYLPRGYDGITWKKLPEPVLDVNEILAQNKASQRDEAISLFIEDASKEKEKGNLVFLGGDFNEPSHLDWTDATKNMFDHNGVVVPWHNSVMLEKQGYLDSYRVKFPDPVSHPGFTWEAYNRDVEISEMIWTPDADDRDRIDFIYYSENERLNVEDVIVVGPSETIVKGQAIQDKTASDKFLEPTGKWPSDHKGVLATFKIE
ncbi:Endonuclease/Exonuclease/phosphatase family protein [Zhouia amylolytica]|uniref:Endonuclease/exonuclease/phosphatase domain-containing protein n=2 Tax=Zhouia amylolytica TaxID=376730 RepID=W2UPD6_9FLAO|nr:endonuclease/exonuclease/phosphatase family protein [Zhouia amylolytica]ETN95336.1 hypothetical protein P278_10580 [Zhouia amylolytica AD3]MCQ0112423.1 endonuclease/exonuclease/phosphatase family protein [Zhouia amylolytica]SFT00153.1 Endonuclease/Exonuclease/phosphatase family protein [Zhouia amylolytica]